ncbi:MAG: ABC transporter ATP-binding protein [Nitrospinota bacterium]
MLRVEDIHTYYGDSHVLQGVSLGVPEGSIIAVLGRNGVGKTTLVRSVIGFTQPRDGRIIFRDMDITQKPTYDIVEMGMGIVPQGRRVFPSLTVEENLTLGASRGNRGDKWSLERIYELFPALAGRSHHRGNKLSGGEQQMLAIARALMTNPQLLLMDEPTEGLAPLLVRAVGEIIFHLKEEGLSILLVEQNMPFALKLADHVHVMSKGQIVHSSSPQELAEREDVKSRYLGV